MRKEKKKNEKKLRQHKDISVDEGRNYPAQTNTNKAVTLCYHKSKSGINTTCQEQPAFRIQRAQLI